MSIWDKSFGELIHHIRTMHGLSTREVARRAGISHAYLSQIESNRYSPKPEQLRKLAAGLNFSYLRLMIEAGYIREEEIEAFNMEWKFEKEGQP